MYTYAGAGAGAGSINARKKASIGSGNYDTVAVRAILYYKVAVVLAKSPGTKL